ncbi:cytochrome c [Donghicola sp. C2-DW-16]|uniref:Cytochrome c n=1 Tax=Donghicola mangrovi TaxID=2729614 RepID=A0ABX2PEV8_9RHOB|nr:cytochrome c [Donghicola mangrovi]NVO27532.1 cytochrome c [Donghicola mangrovi]
MNRLFALGLMALTAVPMAARAELTARSNYVLRCTGCHGIEGMGTAEGGVPPFPGSVGHIASIDAGRDYMMHVPGVIASSLSDAEIAAVMNYVMATFDTTDAPEFTTQEVTRRRALPMTDIVVARRAVVQELETKGISIADYPWP